MPYTKHKPVVFEVGNSRFVGRIYVYKGPVEGWYLDFEGGSNCLVFGNCGLDKWSAAKAVFGDAYKTYPDDEVCWPPAPSLKGLRALIAYVQDACRASDEAAYERILNRKAKT